MVGDLNQWDLGATSRDTLLAYKIVVLRSRMRVTYQVAPDAAPTLLCSAFEGYLLQILVFGVRVLASLATIDLS